MKADIHPAYQEITVVCSCGHTFVTRSTLNKPTLNVEICSNCHDFYTGKKKSLENVGRVSRFREKYARPAATPSDKDKKDTA
ncbi:MAG: 50S ribosomal protein L31 [Gammaproteobacteria bacterium]